MVSSFELAVSMLPGVLDKLVKIMIIFWYCYTLKFILVQKQIYILKNLAMQLRERLINIIVELNILCNFHESISEKTYSNIF